MKRNYKSVILILFSAFLIFCMCVPAAAAENLKVNGKDVKAGDTVTYEYYIEGIDEVVAGAGAYVTYDPKFLQYVDDSIGFDKFNNAMFTVKEGNIYYAAVNAINGYDLSEKSLVISVTFKVLDSAKGSTKIEHKFDEFFAGDDDLTDISSDKYSDQSVLTVNTYEGVNSSPYLGTDADEINDYIASNSSATIDDLLNGNPNSAVSSSSRQNGSNSTSNRSEASNSSGNSSANDSSVSSGNSVNGTSGNKPADSASSGDSLNSTSISSAASDVSTQVGNTDKVSSVNSDSVENSGNGSLLVAGIILVFVVVCIGAAVYFAKNRNK